MAHTRSEATGETPPIQRALDESPFERVLRRARRDARAGDEAIAAICRGVRAAAQRELRSPFPPEAMEVE